MRAIDNYTPEQLYELELKGMLSTTVKRLHPTLKKCVCGFVGTKRELYKHFDSEQKRFGANVLAYYECHGEVPLNEGDV